MSLRMKRQTITHQYGVSNAATLAFVVAVLGAAGCDPATDRPPYSPFTGSTIDTIQATPDVVMERLADVIDSIGILKRSQSVRDGYLGTRGYDVQGARPRDRDIYNPERVVVFRFWADPMSRGRTRVTGEATYLKTHDPSLPTRLAETLVTPGHPGHAQLRAILDALKSQAGG